MLDGEWLDPNMREALMYYQTAMGPKLAGRMFLARSPDEQGPQVSGQLICGTITSGPSRPA